jgi:hypothetical protein
MRRRGLMRLIRSAAFVAVLLLAQAATVAHLELDDSHPAGESCALCAAQSVLGAGSVSAGVLFAGVVHYSPPLPQGETRQPKFHRSYFLARGPPTAS